LTRLVLFGPLSEEAEAAACRLLWAAHHLVVDGVSWRVLLEDLETAYRQAARGDRPVLPDKTTSFRTWSRRLVEHVRQGGVGGEREYWLDLAGRRVPPLPVDFRVGSGVHTTGSARKVSLALGGEETRALLQELPTAFKVQMNDVLLAALVRAFWAWTGSPTLLIALEGHGREPLFDDVDLSRTVGWFTTQFPVLLEAGDAAGCGETLAAVKEKLRRLPRRGIGYGLLRYTAGDEPLARALRQAPQPEVSFNYLGQFDQVAAAPGAFRPTLDGVGPQRSPRALRPHPLEITGLVAGDRFQLSLTYGAGIHRRETIERLAEQMGAELRGMIVACRAGVSALAAADFPLAKLDAQRLSKLVAVLDE
jgi:non-ribosomal peptide synthase protein (TIGR01720 family)